MSPVATVADANEVRRALVTSLAAIRCKCLHAGPKGFALRGLACGDCQAWATTHAKFVARWLFRAAGARTRNDPDGRWTAQASADQYDQIGAWLEQLERLARGQDPDAPDRAA